MKGGRQTHTWVLVALCVAALVACGGGGGGTTQGAIRELKDPRTVPTATVPSTTPSVIPAIDAGQAPRRPTQPPETYVVKAGDTPAAIATQLGVDLNDLLALNGITDPRSLKVGQVLKIPRLPTPSATGTARPGSTPPRTTSPAAGAAGTAGGTRTATPSAGGSRTATPAASATAPGTYTVQAGDTACEIATTLGVSLADLAAANSTTVDRLAALSIGQVLKVPSTKGPPGC